MRWFFEKLSQLEPERDPHEAEFFRLKNPGDAIVREYIQNSLDAARKEESNTIRVNVCFTFGEVEKDNVLYFFDGLVPHLKAKDCALPVCTIPETVPFLTIEDFGTTGLDGVTGYDGSRPEPEQRRNFYDFWLAEGKSSKTGHAAGRWGLGKTTFHVASKIRSFWGLTLRDNDSRQLLMGKALLKSHRINEDYYRYYGYFLSGGKKPVEEVSKIENFKTSFSICRDKEPGFSLVIPFPDEEIKILTIMKAVIFHYFFPIMRDSLEVQIEGSAEKYKTINMDKIHEIACSMDWSDTSWKDIDVGELLMFVKDAIDSDDLIKLNVSDKGSPKIEESSFDENINELQDSFNSGNFLAFKVPVKIQEADGSTHTTHFKIYLRKYPELSNAEEYYVRSGITIPENKKSLAMRLPVRGMLVAEDEMIEKFLGDAENPAHTKWVENTEGFKEKYKNATQILRFIKNSMSEIVSILDQPPQGLQKDFLKEIFSVPVERKPKEGPVSDGGDGPTEPKQPLFRISKINKGFRLNLNRKDISFPTLANVKVAYDIRRGNPFKQYEFLDFDLAESTFSFDNYECQIRKRDKNTIKIDVEGPEFFIEVTGFDTQRDLVIDVKEVKHETQG